jgi:hypothetical protein
MLQEEIEIDTNGKETIVKRAHNADGRWAHIPTEDRTWNEMRGWAEALQQEEAMKKVENEDLNSDITATAIQL